VSIAALLPQQDAQVFVTTQIVPPVTITDRAAAASPTILNILPVQPEFYPIIVIQIKDVFAGGEVDGGIEISDPVIPVHTATRNAAAPVFVELWTTHILCATRGNTGIRIPPQGRTLVVAGVPGTRRWTGTTIAIIKDLERGDAVVQAAPAVIRVPGKVIVIRIATDGSAVAVGMFVQPHRPAGGNAKGGGLVVERAGHVLPAGAAPQDVPAAVSFTAAVVAGVFVEDDAAGLGAIAASVVLGDISLADCQVSPRNL